MPEVTIKKDDTHATPPSGYSKMYPKENGAWYHKSDDGTEAAFGGISDHGALTGLDDDDHTHYHTDARGDTRYHTQTELGSVTPTTEGASLVGTDAKVNLDDAVTVEECLTYLDTHFAGLDPSTHYILYDDFIGTDFTRQWAESKSSGGSNDCTILSGEEFGVCRVISHELTNEWSELSTYKRSFAVSHDFVMKARVKLEQTSNLSVYVGFRGSSGDDAVEFKANSVSGYWDYRCKASGTTSVESEVALDTDWHDLEIRASTSSISFFIDGVSAGAAITTDIPTGEVLDFIFQVYTTGGTATRSMLVDYIHIVGKRQ